MISSYATCYPIEKIRADFPILQQKMNGKRLAFLDSAASSQKPHRVIDRITKCYAEEYANIHRGMYALSQQTTANFEAVRGKIRQFINARSDKEIIFVRGVTEAINLVASSYGRPFLQKGDEIIISALEHHANIVPWQALREEKDVIIKVIPMDDDGNLLIDEYQKLLNEKTRFVAINHISNALGVVNPVKEIIAMAHDYDCPVLLDGAQSAPHQPIDIQDLDADFYCFSGHKCYGPSGIGVLYGKERYLEKMQPYHYGGEMIKTVTFEQTDYAGLPAKFEAGTPAIAEAIGLGEAIDYLQVIGLDAIHNHEQAMKDYAYAQLQAVEDILLYANISHKAGVIPFTIKGLHPHDISTILDKEGVAVRAGHHCAQPIMQRLGVSATVRASIGLYTNQEDIDQLVNALAKAKGLLL